MVVLTQACPASVRGGIREKSKLLRRKPDNVYEADYFTGGDTVFRLPLCLTFRHVCPSRNRESYIVRLANSRLDDLC
jgi:hypothetical protein